MAGKKNEDNTQADQPQADQGNQAQAGSSDQSSDQSKDNDAKVVAPEDNEQKKLADAQLSLENDGRLSGPSQADLNPAFAGAPVTESSDGDSK